MYSRLHMKKVHAVLFSLIMITMSLAGCIGGDGDDGDKGNDGDNGIDGTDGIDGTNGEDGASGEDGMSTLIATSPEPEGVNCPNSGTKIDAGLDVNGNGALDSEEIDSTDYICDGGSSINNMLTSIVQTDDSLECTAGGKTIAHGLDNGDDSGIPANGIMEAGEIDTRITECSKYSPGIFTMENWRSDPYVSELFLYNNELYFKARVESGSYVNVLWKTDGTESGTIPVSNSSGAANPAQLTEYNGELYFSAKGENGTELWKTDGTDSGTQEVIDLCPGMTWSIACGSNPTDLVVVGDKLVFYASGFGMDDNRSLYSTDGTEEGTIMLANTCPGCSDNIKNVQEFNGEVFFSAAYSTSYNNELWKTDGTPEGTVLVKEIDPSSDGSMFSNGLTEFNNHLYFIADAGNGKELWKTDGTNFNTVKVEIESATMEDGYAQVNESTMQTIYATEDRIIVTALLNYGGLDPNTNRSIWAFDPIGNNVTLVYGHHMDGINSQQEHYFFSYGDKLYFEGGSNQYVWSDDLGTQSLPGPYVDYDFESYLIEDDKIYLRMHCSIPACVESDGNWIIFNMSTNSEEAMIDNDNPRNHEASQLTRYNDQIFFRLRDSSSNFDYLGSFDAYISTEIIMQ